MSIGTVAVQRNQNMAASEGWTVIDMGANNNSIVSDSNAVASDIRHHFEVIDQRQRKCRVCSSIIKISTRSYWNLKCHFKNKHHDEWKKIERNSKTAKPKPKVRFFFQY